MTECRYFQVETKLAQLLLSMKLKTEILFLLNRYIN